MSRFPIVPLVVVMFAFTFASSGAEDYPEATATADANVVVSPFPPNKKINITGFLPGDLARDPHTNKVFRIPARKARPLVFKPEIIEDDPPSLTDPKTPKPPGGDLDSLPVRRPEIVEEPDSSNPRVAPGTGLTPPAYGSTSPSNPEILEPPVVDPKLPDLAVRAPRKIDGTLEDFVNLFIRSGQNDDPQAQAKFLAESLSSYYALQAASKDQVIAATQAQITRWPRRIYVVSGKSRFVRWIGTEEDDEGFVIDVQVYQSLKSPSGPTQRGYADHRLTIRQKPDGTFEITGAEERHPHSVLAGQ